MADSCPPLMPKASGKKEARRTTRVRFESDDQLLDDALRLFQLRGRKSQAEEEPPRRARCVAVVQAAEAWHARLEASDTIFARHCRQLQLGRMDRELLAALLLERLGLTNRSFQNCSDLIDFLALSTVSEKLDALRGLSEEGLLYRERLIVHDDPAEDLPDRPIVLDPGLLEEVLWARRATVPGWPVKTEAELHERLFSLTRVLVSRAELVRGLTRGYGSRATLYRTDRQIGRLLRTLERTLELHAEWKLSRTLGRLGPSAGAHEEWLVVLALLGRELGHADEDDFLFRGEGLACCACSSEAEVLSVLRHLGPRGRLGREGWIQPRAGSDALLEDSTDALRRAEFELSGRTVEALGLAKETPQRPRRGDSDIREPRVTLDRLVFPQDVLDTLGLLIGQARNADTLFGAWGLGESLGYGRGVIAVLWGPPGVGKTAASEAIAAALGRPILAVNYAEIEDCYVGQTEKNIVRAFQRARTHGAVLFWDEADGMFYSRDDARYAWERRHVNVLLQEIESFEGVCLLATNRTDIFDPAFERRITLKVGLGRPDRAQRRAILDKLLPAAMPLGDDVDLDRLAKEDLTGGELKNIVLNAARIALRETDGKGPVSDQHFRHALRLEQDGRLRNRHRPIGFSASPGTGG